MVVWFRVYANYNLHITPYTEHYIVNKDLSFSFRVGIKMSGIVDFFFKGVRKGTSVTSTAFVSLSHVAQYLNFQLGQGVLGSYLLIRVNSGTGDQSVSFTLTVLHASTHS